MKFIHTADWQLGMAFGHVQQKADALRRARIDALKQVVALAERERADFIVAAGDLFDDNRIDPKCIDEMARIVSNSPVPVYLLPGNHDPLTQESPYNRCRDLFKGSAIVLREAEPLAIPSGTLYPCPAKTRSSNQDLTAWIPKRHPGDGIRIGIAHGSIAGVSTGDFPISPKAAVSKELDFLALGHWHGCKKIDERMWYCGAPEATAFGQINAGKALVVELSKAGELPKVTEVHLAKLSWQDIERKVHSEAEVDALLKELDGLGNANTLLRLRVQGALKQPELDRLERYAGDRFFHFKLEHNIMLENGTWEYRHPLLTEAAHILFGKSSAPGMEGEAARRALSNLRYFVERAGFQKEEV